MEGNGGARLIAVKSDLVREQLVRLVLDEVLNRIDADLPPDAAAALGRIAESESDPALERLSLAGYWSRVVERERFEPARRPIGRLGAELRTRRASGEGRDQAVAGLSSELASREPAERPDPDDSDSVTWQVPGPGGHVRHYLAVETMRALDVEAGKPTAGQLERGKRAWVSGFLVACCLESARGR